MRQTADSLTAIRDLYKLRRWDLPREYYVAMGRLEKARRVAELAHLDSLPQGLSRAAKAWRLSAKSCTRIFSVARTIADLAAAPDVAVPHVAEAIQMRCLDRLL